MQNICFEMASSKIVPWECGSCTYTNQGSEPDPCIMCRTGRPICYATVAGALAAVTARTTAVNCHEQACVAALAANALVAAAAAAVMAVDVTAHAADAGEAAAVARPLMPVAVPNRCKPNRDTVVGGFVSMLVDIVGTGASNIG